MLSVGGEEQSFIKGSHHYYYYCCCHGRRRCMLLWAMRNRQVFRLDSSLARSDTIAPSLVWYCSSFDWLIVRDYIIDWLWYYRHARLAFARTLTVCVRSVLESQRSMTGCIWRSWPSSASRFTGSSSTSHTNATSERALCTSVFHGWWLWQIVTGGDYDSSRNSFKKITLKRTSGDIKKHRITKFFCYFFSLQGTLLLDLLDLVPWRCSCRGTQWQLGYGLSPGVSVLGKMNRVVYTQAHISTVAPDYIEPSFLWSPSSSLAVYISFHFPAFLKCYKMENLVSTNLH